MQEELPVHPFTGLTALGVLPSGRVVWPIMGGAPEDDQGDEGTDDNGGQDDNQNDGADDKGGDNSGDKPKDDDQKVESLPQWAQDLIRRERGDAQKKRGRLTEAEKKHQEVLTGIAKALGIKTEDDKVDPKELSDKLASSQTEVKSLKVERALDKAARKHGADEDLLVAVLSHAGKLKDIDPTSDTFAEDVDSLVKDAVEKNPKLKGTQAGPGTKQTGSDFSGSGGSGEQKPQDEAPKDMDEYRKWRKKRLGLK